MGTAVEEIKLSESPEVVERDNAVSAFLAERQTQDIANDHSSRVGQVINGDVPHPENKAAEAAEPVAEPAKDPEGTAEAQRPAEPDEVTSAAEQKADPTGTPKAEEAKPEEEAKPTKAQRTRAAREQRMRTSIQAEAADSVKSELDTLKAEIAALKSGKPAEPAAAPAEQPTQDAGAPQMPRISDFGDDLEAFYAACDKFDTETEAYAAKQSGQQPAATVAAPATAKPPATVDKPEQDPPSSFDRVSNAFTDIMIDAGQDETLEDLTGLATSGTLVLTEEVLEDIVTALEDVMDGDDEAKATAGVANLANTLRDKPRMGDRLDRMAKSARVVKIKQLIAPAPAKKEEVDQTISPIRSAPGANATVDPNKMDTGDYIAMRQAEVRQGWQQRT